MITRGMFSDELLQYCYIIVKRVVGRGVALRRREGVWSGGAVSKAAYEESILKQVDGLHKQAALSASAEHKHERDVLAVGLPKDHRLLGLNSHRARALGKVL